MRSRCQYRTILRGASMAKRAAPEFKAEAVEEVKSSGGKIAKPAREKGIYVSTSGNWVRRSD